MFSAICTALNSLIMNERETLQTQTIDEDNIPSRRRKEADTQMLGRKIILTFLAGVTATGALFFLWITQTPSVTYVRHVATKDINNYPQEGEIVPGKIYINDKFVLSVTVENEGYLPAYSSSVRIVSPNSVTVDSQRSPPELRRESVFYNDKTHSSSRQAWVIPIGTLRSGGTKNITLTMSSMSVGTIWFQIEAEGFLPSLIRRSNDYRMVIDSTAAATTKPMRRGDVHVVLQFRAYSICQRRFPCKDMNSDGSCRSYPNSDDARACVISETKKQYEACETRLYDERALSLQLDCLISKHGFKLPLSQ